MLQAKWSATEKSNRLMADWSTQLLLFVLAVIANAFSAFAGGGAGLLQFPMLIFLGLPFNVALATHKIASVALGLGATLRHARSSVLEWQFVALIVATGVPGVVAGSLVILQVPERPAQIALGLLTIGLGLYSYLNRELGLTHRPANRDRHGLIVGGAGLVFIGFLNGSLASGTGLFCTLWLVRWFGLDYQRAVAYTLVLVGVFWNGAGAVTLGILGEVRWDWLPALVLGSVMGGYLGTHWGLLKGNVWIKRAFEVVTLLIGTRLLF